MKCILTEVMIITLFFTGDDIFATLDLLNVICKKNIDKLDYIEAGFWNS